jgi:hypothetical protein
MAATNCHVGPEAACSRPDHNGEISASEIQNAPAALKGSKALHYSAK